MSEPVVSEKEAGTAPGDAPAPTTHTATGQSTPDEIAPEKKKREYKDFGHDEEKATHAKVDMNQIELKAEDLYDKEKVDLETVVMEDVFKLLEASEEGLSTEEINRRLGLFGPNRLESKEQNPFLQFLSFMWNPLSWVMEAAAIVAIALSNGEGRAPDWQDFVGIVLLLFINWLLVSTKSATLVMLSRLSWTRSLPRPVHAVTASGARLSLPTSFPVI
jgi:H+-transporting ATPase